MAIEGVVKQITNFRLELVIGEDNSTDNTLLICQSYAKKYPEIIKLLPSKGNLGSIENFKRTLDSCSGKYIAICEGDDYWTEPLKLQKQVDFLEKNPDYGLVYTDIQVVDVTGSLISNYEPYNRLNSAYRSGYVFYDLLDNNFITTPTVCFRSSLLLNILSNGFKWYTYDMWLWLQFAMVSKIQFFAEKSAAYRKHSGGITSKSNYLSERQPFIYLDIIFKFLRDKHVLSREKNHKSIFFHKTLSILYKKQISIKTKIVLLLLLAQRSLLLAFIVWTFSFKIKKIIS